MHDSFDLYPGYLRSFTGTFDPRKPYRVKFDLHAQKNYKYMVINGKRGPVPQVRLEGSLEVRREPATEGAESLELTVNHVREWATWTGQEPSSKQILTAAMHCAEDPFGTPLRWSMEYASIPILPVKSFRYNQLGPFTKTGTCTDGQIEITGASDIPPARHAAKAPVTTLYSLIDALPNGRTQPGKTVDYLDDLAMFRPGLEWHPLGASTLEIEGTPQTLTGHALVGPAILPLYFWSDAQSRILAIIGRNVAYTLTHAENL